MSKERLIKKVAVTSCGLKGLVLSGTEESYKDNKLVINTFVSGLRHPIHGALESVIDDLRYHVLNICGLFSEKLELKKDEKNTLLHGCEILSFEFERGVTGWFKITASSRLFDTKSQKLSTPKVDSSDGYEHFDVVMNNIDVILEEIKHYVNKTKVISDEELAISFIRHGKGGDVDMEALESMSMEEKVKWVEEKSLKLKLLVNVTPIEEEEFEEEEVEEEMEELIMESAETEEVSNEEHDIMQPSLEIEPLELEPLPEKVKKK